MHNHRNLNHYTDIPYYTYRYVIVISSKNGVALEIFSHHLQNSSPAVQLHRYMHMFACSVVVGWPIGSKYDHSYSIALVLALEFTTARTGYVAPIQGVSQQEVTRLVVLLAARTPALSLE